MQLFAAVWIVIVLGLLAANLPFINQRFLGFIPLPSTRKKSLWIRLAELTAGYFLLGVIAHLLESSLGNVFSQGWEFFAISACLFIVLAFPGFVFQYLRRS